MPITAFLSLAYGWAVSHKSEILTAVSAVLTIFLPAAYQPAIQDITLLLSSGVFAKYAAKSAAKDTIQAHYRARGR